MWRVTSALFGKCRIHLRLSSHKDQEITWRKKGIFMEKPKIETSESVHYIKGLSKAAELYHQDPASAKTLKSSFDGDATADENRSDYEKGFSWGVSCYESANTLQARDLQAQAESRLTECNNAVKLWRDKMVESTNNPQIKEHFENAQKKEAAVQLEIFKK